MRILNLSHQIFKQLYTMAIAFLFLFPSLVIARDVSISVTNTFPVITEFEAPTNPSLEGSTEVHLQADGAVTVISPEPWLIQDNATAFHTVFAWNDTIARPVSFLDSDGDTITLNLRPEPGMPLDLARHDIPVVYITTEKAHLWDPETGIYVWGNHVNFMQHGDQWERPATMKYYDAERQLAFSEPVGIRINGQSSREYYQKGLRIYFDDYGSSDTIEYDFFGEGSDAFERLILRSNRYPDFAISSAINEPQHRSMGHPGSRHLSIAVYLNNEYWGIYSLRERFDSKFVETTRQWADDDYTIIKDNEAVEGELENWEEFLNIFSGPGPFDSHQFFQIAESNIDLDSYIDWIILNACGATSDNMGGKNVAVLKIGGQKWKFMAWDEDILYQSGNLQADHLRFYSAANASEFHEFMPPVWYSGGPWPFTWSWNNVLHSLMHNAEFTARFRHRANALLDGVFSTSAVQARIDSVATIQQPEWENHQDRWSGPSNWYNYHVITFKSFVASRTDIVRQQLDEFLTHWAQPVELSSFSGDREQDQVTLAWHTEREEGCIGFKVEKSIGDSEHFEVFASYETYPELLSMGDLDQPADYLFTDDQAPVNDDIFYRLTHVNSTGQSVVHNWVVAFESSSVFDLRLNEFLAINDTQNSDEFGQYEDWVEIYNSGPETVSLNGLFLSDFQLNPAKWAFPDTSIAPGDFLVIWCDEDLEQGPLHASFKLSGNGEHLGIYSGHASGNQPIDTLNFPPQTADVSMGREIDGHEPWIYFTAPTPGYSNQQGSGVESVDDISASSKFLLAPVSPNPADNSAGVSFTILGQGVQQVELEVFDLRGRSLRNLFRGSLDAGEHHFTWDRQDRRGHTVSSGVYFFRLRAGSFQATRRFTLLR